jgi:hypothetical protein
MHRFCSALVVVIATAIILAAAAFAGVAPFMTP